MGAWVSPKTADNARRAELPNALHAPAVKAQKARVGRPALAQSSHLTPPDGRTVGVGLLMGVDLPCQGC